MNTDTQDTLIAFAIVVLLLSLIYSIETQIYTVYFAKFLPLIAGIIVIIIAYGLIKIDAINTGLMISGVLLIISGGWWWFWTGEIYEKIAILFLGLVAVLFVAYKKARRTQTSVPAVNNLNKNFRGR